MNPALSMPGRLRSSRKGGVKMPMRVLVTAGPTREFIDPVRFISNLSTGNMGYSIADTAAKRGHKTVLISGPANINPPKNIKKVDVVSAEDMFKAVKRHFSDSDCLIMAAAVSDFKPKTACGHKIKKSARTTNKKLLLIQNPDILSWAGRHKNNKLLIGFCMETKGLKACAKRKMKEKNADMVIANEINRNNPAFGERPTTVYVIDKSGSFKKIIRKPKAKIASILLDKIEALWYKKLVSAAV